MSMYKFIRDRNLDFAFQCCLEQSILAAHQLKLHSTLHKLTEDLEDRNLHELITDELIYQRKHAAIYYVYLNESTDYLWNQFITRGESMGVTRS